MVVDVDANDVNGDGDDVDEDVCTSLNVPTGVTVGVDDEVVNTGVD